MHNYFLPHFIFGLLALVFSPFCSTTAQNLDSTQCEALIAQGDSLYFGYQPEPAIAIFDKVVAQGAAKCAEQKLRAQFKKTHTLQSIYKISEAATILANIYAQKEQYNPKDPYCLALIWTAKASYHQTFQQKDSFDMAMAAADAAIAQVPEQEQFFPHKAYFYYLKQNLLVDNLQQPLRKTTVLNAVAYSDKIKGENCLIRLMAYERWQAVAMNMRDLDDFTRATAKLQKMFKNPYFAPYKRLKANCLLKNMLMVGFSQDSSSFRAAANICKAYLEENQLLETAAYIEYLNSLGLVTKDKLVNYPLAREIYKELLATAAKYPQLNNKYLLFDARVNYAYTLIDNRQTDTTIIQGLSLLENTWQGCLSDAHKGGKWGEYPDMSQPTSRAMSVRHCGMILQALIYGYNLYYLKFKKEEYKKPILNTLRAAEALQYGEFKTSINEAQRQQSAHAISELLTRKVGIYRNWYQQNPNSDDLNQLWEIAQQSNARSSRYRQSEEKALTAAGVDEKTLNEYTQLRKQFADAYLRLSIAQKDNNKTEIERCSKQVELASKQTEELRKTIGQKYPAFNQLLGELDWLKIEQVRPWLKNSALIVHYCGRLENYQILVTSDTVLFYSCYLKREEVGRKIIDSLSLFLNNPPLASGANPTYKEELEKILLRTRDTFFRQWDYLEKNKIEHIIIVPDELTAAIPFEVLLSSSDNKNKPYSDWAWMGKTHTIQYLPSLSFWEQSRSQSKKNSHNGKILAFAPTYQRGVKNDLRSAEIKLLRATLSELSGAKTELQNLKQYYYGDYYGDSAANEALLKSKSKEAYTIIHFAMHGLLDENLPELSSLAFSETADTTEDNFLNAYEIAQLPQRAQLVVLSACETAKGKTYTGEGVMSLAQYFMYGGAPAVLATRWQVNDQATAFIMQNFYKYLYEGKITKQAIRQAQQDYLAQARGEAAHPYYWAAFINIGNTDTTVYIVSKNWMFKYYLIGGLAVLVLIGLLWKKFRKKE